MSEFIPNLGVGKEENVNNLILSLRIYDDLEKRRVVGRVVLDISK